MKIICGILLVVLIMGVVFTVSHAEEPPAVSLEARIEKLEAEVVQLKEREAQLRAALIGLAEIMDFNTSLFEKRLKGLEEVVFPPRQDGEHTG